MKIGRLYNRIYAFIYGYFWKTCPRCGRMFGGHECGNDYVRVLDGKTNEEIGKYSCCEFCGSENLLKNPEWPKRGQDIPMPECKPPKEEIDYLKDMQILKLEPGDVIVLRYPGVLTDKAVSNIKTTADKIYPGHEVHVLEENMEIGVIRKKEGTEAIEEIGDNDDDEKNNADKNWDQAKCKYNKSCGALFQGLCKPSTCARAADISRGILKGNRYEG